MYQPPLVIEVGNGCSTVLIFTTITSLESRVLLRRCDGGQGLAVAVVDTATSAAHAAAPGALLPPV